MKKSVSGAAIVALAVSLVLVSAIPASAVTASLGSRSCTGGSGATAGISAKSTGNTTFSIYQSPGVGQGTVKAGSSTYTWKDFRSTYINTYANYVSATAFYGTGYRYTTCTFDLP